MTTMEGPYSHGEPGPLARRDALLSRLGGVNWPFGPLLSRLCPARAADVLDVGAGDGRFLDALRTRGHRGRALGLDLHPSGHPGTLCGTADALPFPAASFDLVTFVRVLAHLPSSERALREAGRVLRPGGRVVLAAHGVQHLRSLGAGPDAAEHTGLTLAALGWEVTRTELRVPVTLQREDVGELAASYGLSVLPTQGPVQDSLHLTVWVARPQR